ncbi:hypothetical protein PVAP13_1KG160110 [Panicum virgatum]|uniref:F-box protein AT5G49610-like beta-propeller domain-containing protein n=1 Tax=Panicum virgatum TaxID=38727 RepID=A0A8T0XCW2_PANVG|nr:hypothetical protein PVAP13_1KG160110 [Panicum virgatum]
MERKKSTLAAAISVVLGDYDLLAEIFLRLGRFHAEFVPMLPQPPELAADCRVILNLFRDGDFTFGVHSPLYRARGFKSYIFREILSRECGHGRLSYFWFELEYYSGKEEMTARVYKLQDDAWSMQTSATTQISRSYSSTLNALSIFLVDDKIYMGITMHNIHVLDLTSSTFSTIKYPEMMAREGFNGEIVLARADGSGVCLVLVDMYEIQLHVWFDSSCDGSAGDWLLISNSTTEDDDDSDDDPDVDPNIFIHAVGDNGEFVFLQVHGCVVYLDVRSSAMQKVYGATDRNVRISSTHPFLIAWPPVFQVLKE